MPRTNAPAKLDYQDLIERLELWAEEFGSKTMSNEIVMHLFPHPAQKLNRSGTKEVVEELQADHADLIQRLKEAQASYGDSKAANEAAESEEEGDTTPEPTPVTAPTTPAPSTAVAKVEPQKGRTPVPA